MSVLLVTIMLAVSGAVPPAKAQTVSEPAVGQLEVQINPALTQGKVQWAAICTATAVTLSLVVSASHCINDDTTYDDIPIVVDYRVGFYGATTSDVTYIHATVVFAGFRDNAPGDPLSQIDISALRLDSPAPATFGTVLGTAQPGDTVYSVGFSLGIRQWAGRGTVVGYYYLDGYGDILIVQSQPNQGWAPGASGSVVYNDKRQIVGILTLGYDPLSLTGIVPSAFLRLLFTRLGVL
jgi:hypothetical protein